MTIEKILLGFSPKVENILPALKEVSAVFGYVDEEKSEKIADYFSVPSSQIYETATFYDLINTKKQPALKIKVCFSTHCALKDAGKIINEIENILHIKAGDENNPNIKLEKVSCLGRCGDGPVVVINDKVYERVTVASVRGMMEEWI